MQRPVSIVQFERFYLGAWVLGLINLGLTWKTLNESTAMRQSAAVIGAWYAPTITAIGLIVPLILWYFIARRGSAVAKWIVVVLFALGAIGVVIGLVTGNTPGGGVAHIISIVTFALQLIAVVMLFRPDTPAWFGETRGDVA